MVSTARAGKSFSASAGRTRAGAVVAAHLGAGQEGMRIPRVARDDSLLVQHVNDLVNTRPAMRGVLRRTASMNLRRSDYRNLAENP